MPPLLNPRPILLASLAVLAGAIPAQGQVIARWVVSQYIQPNNSLPMPPLAASAAAPNVSATPISTGPGIVALAPCGGPLSLLACGGTGTYAGVFFDKAFNADDYYQFTVAPASGYQITYQSLRVPIGIWYIIMPAGQRSTGPKTWQLQYSLDGFATPGTVLATYNVPMSFTTPVGAGASEEFWPTFGLAAVGTRSVPVTFRLYGYNIENDHPNGPQGYPGGLLNRTVFMPQVDATVTGTVTELPCYPDCNTDGQLTVADFGCFQTAFVIGDPYADCNGDGVRTVADFGCFQTRFVQGCP